MQKITIIKIDDKVNVDGEARIVDLSTLDSNIHAIEWDSVAKKGNIEYLSPPHTQQLKTTTDFAPYEKYEEMWVAAAPPPSAPPPSPPTQAQRVDAAFDSNDPYAAALVEVASQAGWTETEFRDRVKSRMGA